MKLRLLAGAAMGLLLSAGLAHAQDSGWYGGIEAGWHNPETYDAVSEFGEGTDWSFDFDDNYAAAVSLGYRLNPKWRTAFEAGYRTQDLAGGEEVGCCDFVNSDGDMQVYSAMFNVIRDFMPDSKIHPFLGAGFGWAKVNMDVSAEDGESGVFGVDDSDSGFAYQALAGMTYQASDRLNVDLTYRFFGVNDIDLTGSVDGDPYGFAFKKYEDHSLMVGLRWAFGAAAAPVMAAPAPAPAPMPVAPVAPPPPPAPAPVAAAQPMSFIVYFPFDQYILTTEANDILDKAAAYAKTNGAAKVMIVGHADKSGKDGYNLRLSQKRAKVVEDALVTRGVASGVLGTDYKGESAPAVDTPDGTKEPLNRRSTIDISF
jgi:outer membrane protein OmpA-like peptidoglycan-associated protein/outer membrane protein W